MLVALHELAVTVDEVDEVALVVEGAAEHVEVVGVVVEQEAGGLKCFFLLLVQTSVDNSSMRINNVEATGMNRGTSGQEAHLCFWRKTARSWIPGFNHCLNEIFLLFWPNEWYIIRCQVILQSLEWQRPQYLQRCSRD